MQDIFLSFHGEAFNGWYPRRTRTESCLLGGDPKVLDPQEKCKVSDLRFPGDPLDVIADDTRFGHPEKVRRTYVILGEHGATASICTTYDYRDYDRKDAYVVSRVYEPSAGKFDHEMPFQTCSVANLITKTVSTEQKPFMARNSHYRTLANFLEIFRDVPKECASRVALSGRSVWISQPATSEGGPEIARGAFAPRRLEAPFSDGTTNKHLLQFSHTPD